MKSIIKLFLIYGCWLFVAFPSPLWGRVRAADLSDNDYTALKVCEGVIQLFKQFPDSVWPGYNLTERPFVFYMPGKWVLLFNCPKEVEGFAPYPKDWPDLGTDVLFHRGEYEGLVGQLAFGLSIDSVEAAAVPFVERPVGQLLGFIVHENFHQYQKYGRYPAFGEIPWEREERYPIQDRENTALAYLEMRALMDALMMADKGEERGCRRKIGQFLAVRNQRWKRAIPFVARYEQGEEINEGTARYVELKSIALMARVKYRSSLNGLTTPLWEDLSAISMPEYLLDDFRGRITGKSISPEDMPRNRVYPVGSAQGFLLDHLGIEWKDRAQRAGPEFTYAQLFREKLDVTEEEMEDLLREAKEDYSWEEVLTATDSLIQRYLNGYDKELRAFEAQSGYRIEVALNSRGLTRSRSSSAKKWRVDNGTRELCNHFDVYLLKNDFLLLKIHDSGVWEENDWDTGRREVVFFDPQLTSFSLDEEPLKPVQGALYRFKDIQISGKNFKLHYSREGTVVIRDHRVKVNLIA